MQLHYLKYFEAVARKKSMNKAAEELFVSQPSLSKAIAALEDELGIEVFIRSNKGVELTEDGKKLYEYTRIVLRQMDLIEGIKSGRSVETFNLSVYPSILNGEILARFYQAVPEHIEISMQQCRIEQIIDQVDNLVSKIGILQVKEIQKKEVFKALVKRGLVYTEIATDRICVSVGKNNPLYGHKSVSIQELLAQTVIRPQDDYFSNLCYFMAIENTKLLEIEKTVFINDVNSMISMLQNGSMFLFSMEKEKGLLKKYEIDTIPLEGCDDNRISIGWIRRESESMSEMAQCYINIMSEYLVSEMK